MLCRADAFHKRLSWHTARVQAAVMRDATLITGDPAKLGLGIVSLFYDTAKP